MAVGEDFLQFSSLFQGFGQSAECPAELEVIGLQHLPAGYHQFPEEGFCFLQLAGFAKVDRQGVDGSERAGIGVAVLLAAPGEYTAPQGDGLGMALQP